MDAKDRYETETENRLDKRQEMADKQEEIRNIQEEIARLQGKNGAQTDGSKTGL